MVLFMAFLLPTHRKKPIDRKPMPVITAVQVFMEIEAWIGMIKRSLIVLLEQLY